jgi:hypothetical protein
VVPLCVVQVPSEKVRASKRAKAEKVHVTAKVE